MTRRILSLVAALLLALSLLYITSIAFGQQLPDPSQTFHDPEDYYISESMAVTSTIGTVMISGTVPTITQTYEGKTLWFLQVPEHACYIVELVKITEVGKAWCRIFYQKFIPIKYGFVQATTNLKELAQLTIRKRDRRIYTITGRVTHRIFCRYAVVEL
jgi:hypothetical protein